MGNSWDQFWAMGHYAQYVWSAYGIAALVVVANVAVPLIGHRRLRRRITNQEIGDD